MVFALTVDDGERESDLDGVINDPSRRPGERQGPIATGDDCCGRSLPQYLNAKTRRMGPGVRRDDSLKNIERQKHQILPVTSFCIRLAISTSRRQACSRNDIMRSMSWSLGSGISILRSPSATFGPGFFSESVFGIGSSILPVTVGSRSASCVLSFSFRSEEHTSEL